MNHGKKINLEQNKNLDNNNFSNSSLVSEFSCQIFQKITTPKVIITKKMSNRSAKVKKT